MRKITILLAISGLLAAACGDDDGDDDTTPTIDASVSPDGPEPDGSLDVDSGVDVDAGEPDAGAPDASAAMIASMQIATARGTADGTGLTLPIDGATVTYLKPALGNDPAGFTVQAEQAGPALFIAVDPATLTPAPVPGDVVSFTITDMGTSGSLRQATAITGFARSAQGADLAALTQSITAATDIVSAIDSYESELISVDATVVGAFAGAGNSFEQAAIDTTGLTGDTNYRIRVPSTLRDSADLVTGCTFSLTRTPVGRFNAAVQLAAFTAGDITLNTCPAPTVVSAAALSATSVLVTFDRRIDPASVLADGSQFSFDNGLTASAATVSDRTVTVTTGAQLGGTTYTVTVANTVEDLLGTAVGMPNSAMFDGFVTLAGVRINEVNANVTSGCDLIELRVISDGTISGYKLQERNNQVLVTFPSMNVVKNDIIVVHMNSGSLTCNPGTATQESTATNQQPAATFIGNFDTAYDFWSADSGLTNTDNVFTLFDGTNAIIDAVFVADDPTGTAAADTETQAAAVAAANQWQNVGGGTPPGGYVDDDFCANAALDLNATGATSLGDSIQRVDDTDDNDKADWGQAAQSWGARNTGQNAL